MNPFTLFTRLMGPIQDEKNYRKIPKGHTTPSEESNVEKTPFHWTHPPFLSSLAATLVCITTLKILSDLMPNHLRKQRGGGLGSTCRLLRSKLKSWNSIHTLMYAVLFILFLIPILCLGQTRSLISDIIYIRLSTRRLWRPHAS